MGQGDEAYGCLAAFNTLRALTNGAVPFEAGEALQLLEQASVFRSTLKSWGGYDLVFPRVKIIEEPTTKTLKVGARLAGWMKWGALRVHACSLHAHMALRGGGGGGGPWGAGARGGGGAPCADGRPCRVEGGGRLLRPDPALAGARGPLEFAASAAAVQQCSGCGSAFVETHRCKQCLSAAYCSQACKDRSWPAHKDECRRLQEARGARAAGARSGSVGSSSISNGSSIAAAAASSTAATAADKRCDGCGQRFARLQRCSGCKACSFCTSECHKAHWNEHKAECKRVQAAG